MSKLQDYRSVRFFWREKGDIERMIGIEKILAANKDLRRAWRAYQKAKRDFETFLETEIDRLEDQDPEMCGGCGATHPDDRCINCHHDFYPGK